MKINLSNILGGSFIIILGTLFGFLLGKIVDFLLTGNVFSLITLLLVLAFKQGINKFYFKKT